MYLPETLIRHLTNSELQGLAMMYWLKTRLWIGISPPSNLCTMKDLLRMRLLTETYLEDGTGWELQISAYGNQFFEQLSVITRIRTFLHCQLESEAVLLIEENLSIEHLPEFIVHPDKDIREAAVTMLEEYHVTYLP